MTLNPTTSACRACRNYTPEGRRGGFCQQLGVPVRSSWNACSLALPPFAPSWTTIEEVVIWQQEMVILREMLPSEESQVEVAQPKNMDTPTNIRSNVDPVAA